MNSAGSNILLCAEALGVEPGSAAEKLLKFTCLKSATKGSSLWECRIGFDQLTEHVSSLLDVNDSH